jgi:hypothetical protein
MKTHDTNEDQRNIIDATKALKNPQRGKPHAAGSKALRRPELSSGDLDALDRFIAARRRQAAAEADANELKPAVLALVKVHQQIARKGAVVKLTKLYDWKYGVVVAELAKTLADERERARENGSALATVTPAVAFEDVRAKERSKRERMKAS